MKEEITTTSYEETQRLGEEFAENILVNGPQEFATVIELVGELGSGKTTFVQGFASNTHIRKENITSPTFVIMKHYEIDKHGFKDLYHIDAYRLKSVEDMLTLGLADIVLDKKNIVLIEWPEVLEEALPTTKRRVTFRHIDEHKRSINLA